MIRILIAALVSILPCASSLAQVPAGALTTIGVAAAVRGAVKASAPGQAAGRVIGSGKPVYLNDHVTTGPDARLQIMLMDETTFTLGPNSDMVLDEFVYDPKTAAGKVSARITDGTFRFITGKIAQKDPANMKVALPVGTIGIRGTMVAGHVHHRDADILLIGPGRDNNALERRGGITVFNEHGRTVINSSGYGVRIVDGGGPSRGFRFSMAQLDAILRELEPGRTAGAEGPANAPKNSGDLVGRAYQESRVIQAIASQIQSSNQNGTQSLQSLPPGAGCGASNGPDCWSDLIAIQSGTAGYQATGNLSCSGGGCVNVGTTFNYAVNVNFTAQTFGAAGGTGQIVLSGTDGNFDSISLPTKSLAGLSGTAKYTFTAADVPVANSNTGNGDFSGTAITFQKVNGQVAGAMQMNMTYANTNAGVTASGSATASKGSFYSP
jgi:hypothetical protein